MGTSSLEPWRSGAAAYEPVLDLAAGSAVVALTTGAAVARRTAQLVGAVTGALPRPLRPKLPPGAGRLVEALERRGRAVRSGTAHDVSRLLDVLVPVVLEAVLRRVDLTQVVARHVDLEALVARVDLDAAAARLDVDAVAGRLDVDAVIDRLDLTALVRDRVDLDLLVSLVDLDKAAGRLDVDAVAARLDLDAVVRRLDLVGIAEEVIDAIDLPEIIRESTGSVASDTVRGVRMQSIAGDEAVGRVVDRFLLRRGRRSVQAPQRVPGVHGGQDEGPVEPGEAPGQRQQVPTPRRP